LHSHMRSAILRRLEEPVALIEQSLQDVRYAFRLMRRNASFTFVAALSLALGIGVNALLFSIVNALLLKPLPIANPEQVVFLEPGGAFSMSFPAYLDYRDRSPMFDELAGYRIAPMDLEAGGGAVRAWGYLVTGNYFDLLGLRPGLGRFLDRRDDGPSGTPVAVLSYDCWRSRFGQNPGVIGSTIRLNRQPFTVIGVAAEGFRGTELFYRPEIWVPMALQPRIEVGNPWLANRFTQNTWVIGRLKSGVAPSEAAANLTSIAAQLAREYPASDRAVTFTVSPPGLVGSGLRTPVAAFALSVMALAAVVLLIACVNLAAALAARGNDRQRELAIRLSMGASRGRIVRQISIETIALACLGGGGGWGLATVGARALSALRVPVELPVQFDVHADIAVLGFAFAVSLAAALLFGVAPALHASRVDPNAALKGQRQRPIEPRGRVWLAGRDLLIVAQVSLCFVLLAACLVSLRGLHGALTMQLGMETRGVGLAGFELGLAGYDRAQREAFQRRALDEVRRLPGIVAAAYGNSLPLNIDRSTTTVFPESQPGLTRTDALSAVHYQVSPGFFSTLKTRFIEGRDFEWRDDGGATRVAIVNQAFVRTILRGETGVGRRFAFGRSGPLVEIVGVVEDGKYVTLSEAPRPAVFDPILQSPNTSTILLARSSAPELETVAAMRRTLNALDPSLPLYETTSLQEMLAFVLFPNRAAAVALTAFGLLAVVLAATGIYGVVSYATTRRQREIGIRVALGARRPEILRLVLARIGTLMAAGAAIGLGLTLVVSRILSSIVYQASPRDPLVLSAVFVSMIGLGLISCWMPARRALRLNPADVLKTD
jgi:predicted permease